MASDSKQKPVKGDSGEKSSRVFNVINSILLIFNCFIYQGPFVGAIGASVWGFG